MLRFLSDRITNFLLSQKTIDKEMKAVYIYGIELFLSSVLCVILVVLSGLIIGRFWESLLFLLSFIFLRKYTGGLHCNSYFACTATTVLTFFVSVALSEIAYYFPHSKYIHYSIAVFIVLIILLLSPVSNPNKPILAEDRVKYKTIAMIIFCFHLGMMTLLKNYINTEIILATDFISCVYVIMGLIKNKTERRISNEVQKSNG